MKVLASVRERDVVEAVLDLAAVAVVLTLHTSRVHAALGRSRFIDHADRLRVNVLARHQLLTAIAKQLLIPLNGFEKPLQRPRSNSPRERHRFDILTLHIAEQPADVNREQASACRPAKAIGKQNQKLGQQFPQRCDILERHGTTLRGFHVRHLAHGGSFFSSPQVNSNNPCPLQGLAHFRKPKVALSN